MKGIPDSPTPANLPAVPIDLSLANWNDNVVFYEKQLNASQLAEAQAFVPNSGGSSGLSSGAIAGIAVGAVAGVALVAAALLLARRRYVRSSPMHDAEQGGEKELGGHSVKDTIARMQPVDPEDLTSMTGSLGSLGKSTTLGSRGVASLPISNDSATLSTNSRNSLEAATVAGELGGEWLVDVSQLTFVMNPEGQPTELGAGAQGVVYKTLLRGTEPVAAKVIAVGAGPSAVQSFMQEARMLRQLRHRNMLQFVGVALHADKAVVLTEFMEGRDLSSALSRKDSTGKRYFSWYARGRQVAADVAAALAFLHPKRVLHLDIKSSNVLLSRDMGAKLGDVGVSRLLTDTHASMSGAVGTFAWCAPEVLIGKPASVSFPADIYSMGVLLREICTGEVPLRGRLEMPSVPEQCPQEGVDLLLRCLSDVPAERPTAAQLLEELAGLAGHSLGGCNGVLSGADGLERATGAHARSASDDVSPRSSAAEAPAPAAVRYDGRRLAGVEMLRSAAPATSPFA
ncbi:serine threonine-kinase [Micractinium conductrix]|uniref:Serine threonine-kinase n=1 Tax=Micractinium conductrix TaxID=554055 RepID=A0A2P6VAY6_9CHLO|nr:serine threonine-kinase [Micractinium conductrix]|eukprot:PSC71262.1 serine threonine-kinase [Micractinium conductrix]